MPLTINTNIASMIAQHALARHTEALIGNFRQLSTELRIATAADDGMRQLRKALGHRTAEPARGAGDKNAQTHLIFLPSASLR